MAGNFVCDAEDLLLFGDSSVEYGGSSSDCESAQGIAMISMVRLLEVLMTRK